MLSLFKSCLTDCIAVKTISALFFCIAMAHKNAKKHKSWSGGGCKSGLNQTAASCGLHFTKQDSALYEGTVFFADSES